MPEASNNINKENINKKQDTHYAKLKEAAIVNLNQRNILIHDLENKYESLKKDDKRLFSISKKFVCIPYYDLGIFTVTGILLYRRSKLIRTNIS